MNPNPVTEIVSSDLALNLTTHQLFQDGEERRLSSREFDLISELMQHPGELFSVDRIWTEIWGEDPAASKQDKYIVNINIKWLREKIEHDPVELKRILTVRGVGYYFAG
jgi:DNA-binding response OmpR family regulator